MSLKRILSRIGIRPLADKNKGRGDLFDADSINIRTALSNYNIFQKFSDYSWPSWVTCRTNPSSPDFRIPCLPLLENTSRRDGVYFSDYVSTNCIFIDSGGMITPSYASWSVEIWFMIDGVISRQSDTPGNVKLKRSSADGTVKIVWAARDFTVETEIFGGRTPADEAFIEIKSEPKVKKPCHILVAVRPYSTDRLGGLSKIDYESGSGILALDGSALAGIYPRPEMVMWSDGIMDINPADADTRSSVKSPHGLASFCAAYPAEKGASPVYCRIALSEKNELRQSKIDFSGVKNNFSANSSALSSRGFNASINDPLFNDWFYGLKNSMLSYRHREKGITGLNDFEALKRCSIAARGMMRMGFAGEALSLFDYMLSAADIKNTEPGVESLSGAAWLLKTASDIYTLSRNSDFINANITALSAIAGFAYETASKIKSPADLKSNTIDRYRAGEGHFSDLIPVVAGFEGYAYLARNLGLFGDELKFTKLAASLQESLVDAAFAPDINDPFYCRYISAGFPYALKAFSGEKIKVLIRRIRHRYGDKSIYIESAGVDTASEISLAAAEFTAGLPAGVEKIYDMMKHYRAGLALPDYSSPVAGSAVYGSGDSSSSASLMFCALRNMLFIDSEERLVLFPAPQEQWFKPGKKITISAAPTRFGLLNMTLTVQENDVMLTFDDLMKFIPPDIMINLPFKAKIVPGDDFIVKKEDAQSFVINGWPSFIRFIKK